MNWSVLGTKGYGHTIELQRQPSTTRNPLIRDGFTVTDSGNVTNRICNLGYPAHIQNPLAYTEA